MQQVSEGRVLSQGPAGCGQGPRAGAGGARGGTEKVRKHKKTLFEHPPCLDQLETPCSLDTLRRGGPGPPARMPATFWHKGVGVSGHYIIVLVPRRTCSGTGPIVGATDPHAVAGERPGSACAIEVKGLTPQRRGAA